MTSFDRPRPNHILTGLRLATGPGFNHIGASDRVIWAAAQQYSTRRPDRG